MIRHNTKYFLFFFFVILALPAQALAQERNPQWAEPLQLEGVENFYKVNDWLYRSEQPKETGFKNLEEFGISSVVSLRTSNDDRKLAAGTNLNLVSVPIVTWTIEDKDVAKALGEIRKAEKPVLLHCRHGADRTGLIIALYRVMYHGWSKEEAKDEMLNGGYGFHSIWSNIPEYLDEVDIEKLRDMVE